MIHVRFVKETLWRNVLPYVTLIKLSMIVSRAHASLSIHFNQQNFHVP